MLYKFKSQATADLIMLEPAAHQILHIIGKDHGQSLLKGILLPREMPGAVAALQAAVAQERALQAQREQEAHQQHAVKKAPEPQGVSLQQRVTPFIELLKRCLQEDQVLVWGV
jgi:hypothetical protein